MNAFRRLVNQLNNQHVDVYKILEGYKQLRPLHLTPWGTVPSPPPKSPPMLLGVHAVSMYFWEGIAPFWFGLYDHGVPFISYILLLLPWLRQLR